MEAIASSAKVKCNNGKTFKAQAFLDSSSVARTVLQYRTLQLAYAQGDPATSVMYIQEGKVKSVRCQ